MLCICASAFSERIAYEGGSASAFIASIKYTKGRHHAGAIALAIVTLPCCGTDHGVAVMR